MELQFQWEIVGDEIPVLFENLFNTVKSELEYLKDQLQSKYICTVSRRNGNLHDLDSSSSTACNTLIEGIDARIRGMEYSIGLYKDKFTAEMRYLSTNSLNVPQDLMFAVSSKTMLQSLIPIP